MQLLDLMYRNGPLQCFPQLFYLIASPALRLSNPTTPHATRPAGVLSGMRCGDVVAPNGSGITIYRPMTFPQWSPHVF
jgi:hypothetical protein